MLVNAFGQQVLHESGLDALLLGDECFRVLNRAVYARENGGDLGLFCFSLRKGKLNSAQFGLGYFVEGCAIAYGFQLLNVKIQIVINELRIISIVQLDAFAALVSTKLSFRNCNVTNWRTR